MKHNTTLMPKMTLYASIFGHGLELYDFTLYGALISLLSESYFSFSNSSFYLALMSLSTGYIARPFGALLIGYMSDLYGRKRALIFTIFCASIATGSIGLCPSYEIIGMLAPIVLVFARLLQGLCAGAETSNSSIFLIEHCNANNTTFGSAMVFLSGGLGCVVALLTSVICLKIEYSWGWRVPFIVGMIAGLFVLYLRLKVKEGVVYKESKHNISKIKLREVYLLIKPHNKAILCTFVCGTLSGITSTTIVVFANLFLQKQHGMSVIVSIMYSIYGMIAFLFSCFLCSKISSTIFRQKVINLSLLGLVMWSVPYFLLLNTSIFSHILIAQVIFAICAGAFISTVKALVIEQFPVYIRCTMVSFWYNIGYALTSGMYILSSFWLINFTGCNISPFIIVCIFAFLMWLVVSNNKFVSQQ